MRGVLKTNRESKIYTDGRTYDNKLYTFKECDYEQVWHSLDIMSKKLPSSTIQNIIGSAATGQKQQLQQKVKEQSSDEDDASINDIAVLQSQPGFEQPRVQMAPPAAEGL